MEVKMEYCLYTVNETGEINVDVLSKFPGGGRDGYTVLECGYKTYEEAMRRVEEIKKERK